MAFLLCAPGAFSFKLITKMPCYTSLLPAATGCFHLLLLRGHY
ncbi:hypothetical protein CPter291_4187 [Collimonas pratensis]|uniref:Uncharacterized protein n=1 Tax=Collimonas pratensis TaxID=279113 RepID=A0A127R340_9BURK|nr:hypothetical protein CPter91_4190 [Collimonas pratensis]AMP16417.1 hypothetical protein CPter291_4187 [Collimonas pratensis]